MSEVRLLIRDADGDWSGTIHGSVADQAIAALSVDPCTIAELKAGMRRFVSPESWQRPLSSLRPGSEDEPHDAGLVVIDLIARLVAIDSTYSSPGATGSIPYDDGEGQSQTLLRYHLSSDWTFLHGPQEWRGLADERRRERAVQPAIDARAVFFGRPLIEFIARELFARKAEIARIEALAGDERRSHIRSTISDIHAAWLLTPRADLAGCSPRAIALERHDQIDWDMQDRSEQWSMVDQCPPRLGAETQSYRCGGFGTHELVVYYYLVRELLCECFDRVAVLPAAVTLGDFLADVVPHLEVFREKWLDIPEPEYSGRTPRSVIENERARLPEGGSGRDHVIDPDCPCCQMLADMPGPSFWHLDGCNMDDDFAFDISHATREEWEAERREWEAHWQKCEAERAERERLGLNNKSVWKSSFVAPANSNTPLPIRLFGISCHLSELVEDLRRDNEPKVQSLIDRLNREFGNVREIAGGEDESFVQSLLDPVVDRLRETLGAIGEARPELTAKCEALSDEIWELRGGDVIPF